MSEFNLKVNLSGLIEDLNNGLTRWKKDDLGNGSIEKKYGLSTNEMAHILSHPKLSKLETRVRSFEIVDDLEEEVPVVVNSQPKTTIIVEQPTRVVAKKSFSNENVVSFI